jgi:hypothetical protein
VLFKEVSPLLKVLVAFILILLSTPLVKSISGKQVVTLIEVWDKTSPQAKPEKRSAEKL